MLATILNVDDDQEGRSALTQILQNRGFAVREAGTAKEALHLAKEEPDLILLDVNLPDLNGFEACRRMKADPATASIPVLHLSGCFVTSQDKAQALEGGADGYLTKPVEPPELVATIKALLRLRHAEDGLREASRELAQSVNALSQSNTLLREEVRKRQRSDEELRAREELLAEAEKLALLGSWAWDIAADCLTWSNGLFRIFGQRPGEFAATLEAYLQRVHPEDRLRARQVIEAALRDAQPFTYESRIVMPTGAVRTLYCQGRVVTGSDDRPTKMRGYFQDITERRRLEAQFRQAQKMDAVGRLAGGVAHDFNNLLTVINGCIELLLGSQATADQRALFEEIDKAGARAASLTTQLLAFSRQQVVAPQALDLNGVVAHTERMLRRLIGEDVELTFKASPGLWQVEADKGQVEQVLMNLAVNARDAMPQGGRLTIETANVSFDAVAAQTSPEVHEGQYVLLAVNDTGCGMNDEVKAHLFEPFFTTKGQNKGTGLGLATVYGVVKQAGGFIVVYSEPGRGTAFKVYLPRVRATPTEQKEETAPEADRGGETVLVVEDEKGVRGMMSRSFQESGYSVLEAANAEEAFRLCEQYPKRIDLLVTDVVMPQMGGRDLAVCLTCTRPGLKVLYVSGYTDEAIVRHGELEADVAFLQKPFTPASLTRKVREVLDRER